MFFLALVVRSSISENDKSFAHHLMSHVNSALSVKLTLPYNFFYSITEVHVTLTDLRWRSRCRFRIKRHTLYQYITI